MWIKISTQYEMNEEISNKYVFIGDKIEALQQLR